MRRLALLVVAVLWLPPRPATAKEREAPCTPARAERLTVRALAAEPKRYVGRCVTVSAVKIRFALYDDVEGVYAGLRVRQGDLSESHAAFGLDPGPGNSANFARVSVTGPVGDCDVVHAFVREQAEKGELVMASGYCHYHSGPFLQAKHVVVLGPERFERRLPGAAVGDLMQVAADWPARAKVEATADRFVEALRAGDVATLTRLGAPDYDPKTWAADWGTEIRGRLRFLQRSPVFTELRAGRTKPQRILLASPEASEADAVTVCFCRTTDCTGRWPIATVDADNLPSRPYACVVVADYMIFRQGVVPSVQVQMAKTGLAEPRK